MKHLILIAAVCVSSAAANAQTTRVYAKHLQASEKLQLKTRTITDFSISLFSTDSSSETKIPTAKAVADFVRARAGGGAGGAVSSVFGRSGAVVPNAGDYSSFYAPIVHTHPLNDLTQSGAALGQVPVWTLSGWQPGTVSGGSSTATSLVTGIAPTTIGVLFNDTFPGTSLNTTNWSAGVPTGATVNNGYIITAGASDWSRAITLNNYHPFERLKITIEFTANSKGSGDAWGLSQTNPLSGGYQGFAGFVYFKFDQSNGTNSGRFSIGGTTAANEFGYSQPLQFSSGENIRVTIERKGWMTFVVMENLSQPSYSKAYGEYEVSGWGSQGKLKLAGLNATGGQKFTRVKFETECKNFNYTDGALVLGDSYVVGGGATEQGLRFADYLFKSQHRFYEVVGANSNTTVNVRDNFFNEVIQKVRPKTLIIWLGRNDINQHGSVSIFQTALDTLVVRAQTFGVTNIILVGVMPTNAATNSLNQSFNTAIGTIATNRNATHVNIYNSMLNGSILAGEFYADGVHPNSKGHALAGDLTFKSNAAAFSTFVSEKNNAAVTQHNYGWGDKFDALAVWEKGVLKAASPAKVIRLFDGEYVKVQGYWTNTATNNYDAPYLQPGSIGVAGPIKSNDAVIGAKLAIGTNWFAAGYGSGRTVQIVGDVDIRGGLFVGSSADVELNSVGGNRYLSTQTQFGFRIGATEVFSYDANNLKISNGKGLSFFNNQAAFTYTNAGATQENDWTANTYAGHIPTFLNIQALGNMTSGTLSPQHIRLYGTVSNGRETNVYLNLNKTWTKVGYTIIGKGLRVGDTLTPSTGLVEYAAGTSSVAPVKFTPGTNLTTPVNGTVEYDGTNYYVTSGGIRYTLTMSVTGTAAPATTPAAVGIMFVDTVNKKIYVSTGTTNSGDWTVLN